MIHEVFCQCSIANLKLVCGQYMRTTDTKTRTGAYNLISQASMVIQEQIRQAVMGSMDRGGAMRSCASTTIDHNHDVSRSIGGDLEMAVDQSKDSNPSDRDWPGRDMVNADEEGLCENGFMRAPSKEAIDAAIEGFIDRTSNAALAFGVCAVCARETPAKDLSPQRVEHMPSPHRLKPNVDHPAHHLINGMLLHTSEVTRDGFGDVCSECLRALKADRVPMYALANGMWIGEIPHELAYLTLPERLLIAKYFPAAYVIKLYPKKKGARYWDKRQMYSGLRGNVSTYRLDQAQIASMVDGSIMPQVPEVLATTIGITFVGPKNIPERGMPEMFRVRRTRVRRALEWLKENNPLFRNITISESRLAQLPEDDIPYELRAIAKLSTDVNMLYAEQDGYVPPQEGSDCEQNDGMPRFP
jgi:hypothetical protein